MQHECDEEVFRSRCWRAIGENILPDFEIQGKFLRNCVRRQKPGRFTEQSSLFRNNTVNVQRWFRGGPHKIEHTLQKREPDIVPGRARGRKSKLRIDWNVLEAGHVLETQWLWARNTINSVKDIYKMNALCVSLSITNCLFWYCIVQYFIRLYFESKLASGEILSTLAYFSYLCEW